MVAVESPSKEDKSPILIVKTQRNSKTEFSKFGVGDQIGDIVIDEIISIIGIGPGYNYIVKHIAEIPAIPLLIELKKDQAFTWYGDTAKMIYDFLSQTQMK